MRIEREDLEPLVQDHNVTLEELLQDPALKSEYEQLRSTRPDLTTEDLVAILQSF